MKKVQIPIALEGYPFIGYAAFLSLVFALLGWSIAAIVGICLTSFILYFFRDPERVAPIDEDALISPADGKVIIIEKMFDERFVNDHVYKVSIFMNVFNVHVNRMPFPGKVEKIQYSPGKFYSADSAKGALENEYCTVTLKTKNNHLIGVVQIAGLIARRIVCWAEKGDSFQRGERFGLIRFGSRVDLYLPIKTHLEVSIGQKVRAGESILGYLG